MMYYLNKLMASIVWSFSRGSEESFVFNIAYFGSKFMSSLPIAILFFSLLDIFVDFPIFSSRIGSFIAIMMMYPVVDYFTIKRPEVKKFIAETSEEEMERYVNQFRYGLVALILIIVALIMFLTHYIIEA